MIQLHRLVDGFVLSIAAAALGLAGCGADTAPTSPAPQNPIFRPATAGSGAPAITPAPSPVTTPTAGVGATAIRPPSPAPTSVTPPVANKPPVAATAGAGAAPVPPTTPVPAATAGAAAPAAPAPAVEDDANWQTSRLGPDGKLIPPTDGWQLATPEFMLQPGQEVFNCYHAAVPSDKEFPVAEWDSQMSPGSHHFILYRTAGDTVADGTLTNNACTQGFGGTTWLYTAGSPRGRLKFPKDVGMTLSPKERITFDMHYINTTSAPIKAHIALNAYRVQSEKFQKADAQISFNFGIAVPPHGTQTVQGDCTPVAGAKYFLMQTHSHKYTTKAIVQRKTASGQLTDVLSMTTDWEKPEVRLWDKEPFLTFAPGETFHYSCSYQNDTSNLVTVGISAELNEMCMAEAYFFPSGGGIPACN